MKEKINSKPAKAWAIFCKEAYNADPDDVSDAHELANHSEMRDTLRDKRVKFLKSIDIPKYTSK